MPAQTVIKVRRDIAANWESVDPTLASGEIGFETDTNQLKVGNGTDEWTVLPYASGAGGASVDISETAPADPEEGDVWFNSTEGRAYIYYDSFWVDLNPGIAGPPGATGATGFVASDSEPEDTSVLWLDTDETPDVPVPAGGTTGQVLIKSSSDDYDTDWVNPPSGNFLINGAMQVAQRGTATTGVTTSGYYTADRWLTGVGTMGTWTQTVENDGPTGSGFRKSFKILCTTADASPAAGDFVNIRQSLEGQNIQSIRKGTSEAKQLTMSFWVKANVTGTYTVELNDLNNTRVVAAPYSILTSGTWEKKTLVFPADTTGVLSNDNAVSLRPQFWLGAGSDFTSGTLATSWESTNNANRAVGQVNLAAATNNYWQITGVQLELGDIATEFQFQDIQKELAACQRYFASLGSGAVGRAYAATNANVFLSFPAVMRATPTLSFGGNFTASEIGVSGRTVTAVSLDGAGTSGASVILTSSGLTSPNMVGVGSTNNLQFNAEL